MSEDERGGIKPTTLRPHLPSVFELAIHSQHAVIQRPVRSRIPCPFRIDEQRIPVLRDWPQCQYVLSSQPRSILLLGGSLIDYHWNDFSAEACVGHQQGDFCQFYAIPTCPGTGTVESCLILDGRTSLRISSPYISSHPSKWIIVEVDGDTDTAGCFVGLIIDCETASSGGLYCDTEVDS